MTTGTGRTQEGVASRDLPAGLAGRLGAALRRAGRRAAALTPALLGLALLLALGSYDPADPGPNVAAEEPVRNLLGAPGAALADLLLSWLGLAAFALVPLLLTWSWRLHRDGGLPRRWSLRLVAAALALGFASLALAALPTPVSWTLRADLGGVIGLLGLRHASAGLGLPPAALAVAAAILALLLGLHALALSRAEWAGMRQGVQRALDATAARLDRLLARRRAGPAAGRARARGARREPALVPGAAAESELSDPEGTEGTLVPAAEGAGKGGQTRARRRKAKAKEGQEAADAAGQGIDVAAPAPPIRPARGSGDSAVTGDGYVPPALELLAPPDPNRKNPVDNETLDAHARQLESVLKDFGVKGEIVRIRPGPVVTRYDLEPAPGTKTARVVNLADDIARSMAAVSVRVAVVAGSSQIGIEMPNPRREVVHLRELLASRDFESAKGNLPLILGKDIAGAPQIVDLARMPHLLVAGTTGSGKSVGVNAMLLSLMYRFSPERVRFILIDPKMLELSVYEDIPHLLSPVVTDPKKAVVALKWAVQEMEERYRKMSRLGVRNIDGYNARIAAAADSGEVLTRKVQTGFDPDSGQPIHEEQALDNKPLPYIVIVVDEMADLMLVAGKDIEMAVQRLAQMARAAGIHVIMATQRPSVDVITGTIKANFPTRISFHVTSKIDSRTILGETGAEQLLGQGDMLYMAHGGRITRVHGPLVTDAEVEKVVAHLKTQGPPDYVEDVVTEAEDGGPEDLLPGGGSDGEGDLYQRAVAVVCQHRKASTSFVQRQLQIGYNRAARLVERMEGEGVVGPANHVGKREILIESPGERGG